MERDLAKRADGLPMPFVSAWDPRAAASGSIDPLGALRPQTAIATTLFPGVSTITTRVCSLNQTNHWIIRRERYSTDGGEACDGGAGDEPFGAGLSG